MSGETDGWTKEDWDAYDQALHDTLFEIQKERERLLQHAAWLEGYQAGYRDEREGWIKSPYGETK